MADSSTFCPSEITPQTVQGQPVWMVTYEPCGTNPSAERRATQELAQLKAKYGQLVKIDQDQYADPATHSPRLHLWLARANANFQRE